MCSEISGEQPCHKLSHENGQGAARRLDPTQAEKFLCWVASPGARFQFRAIPERADVKGRRTINFLGTFAEDGKQLARLNLAGYGIFAIINETAGTSDKDVTSIRCVFADFDEIVEGDALVRRKERLEYFCGVSPVTLVRKGTPGLAPVSMAIESSPGKFHTYWRAHDFSLDRFKPFQKELASALGSDSSVATLSRVMRIPGFLHQKGEPFLSRIVFTRSGFPYSVHAGNLEKALARTIKKFKVKVPKVKECATVPEPVDLFSTETLRRINGILSRVATAEPGERNSVLFWGACLFAEMALPPASWALLSEAGRQCGLSDAEIKATIASAMRREAA